jgi:hypothetical protein
VGNTELLDESGRTIPSAVDRVFGSKNRGYFCLEQQDVDLEKVYQRSKKYLSVTNEFIEKSSFVNRLKEIQLKVSQDRSVSNLLKGPYVPFILPNTNLNSCLSVDTLIAYAGDSFVDFYENKFKFSNLVEGPIASEITFQIGSRWENFQSSDKFIVGIYFPTALSGFAIPDHVNVISRFPDFCKLSGIAEVSAAIVGTPSILDKRDGKYPNLLALTANLSTSKPSYMFWFYEAYGWNLVFNSRSSIGAVSEYYSGGISVT